VSASGEIGNNVEVGKWENQITDKKKTLLGNP